MSYRALLLVCAIVGLFWGLTDGCSSRADVYQGTIMSGAMTAVKVKNHTVTIPWTLSPSPKIKSQFIFRQVSCTGKFVQMVILAPTITSWTDRNVKGGNTYCYCMTAKGKNGVISSPSNIVKALVPSP